MPEEIIYSNNNVQVTNSRVIADGITYPIRNINSVGVKKVRHAAPVSCIFIGFSIPCLLIGASKLLKSYNDAVFRMLGYFEAGLWNLLAFAVLASIAGGLLLLWNYRIAISNASGVSYILKSKNKESLEDIVAHINEAIIKSSQ